MKPRKIACVVQRYGLEVAGGAEYCARLLTEHLARHCLIEVLTTCALDYNTWSNHYPAGSTMINGISVQRFPVQEPRNIQEFTALTHALFEQGLESISFVRAMEWISLQGPRSRGLIRHLQEHGREYDLIIFFTYLYGPTFYGLPLVREKAVLVPTAHNEPPIYLQPYASLFRMPRGLIYLTDAERDFVVRLHQNRHLPSIVSGIGIDLPENVKPERFREKFGIHGPFLLYLGRLTRAKGCHDLIALFLRLKQEWTAQLKLVLLGQQMHDLEIPDHPDLIYAGTVSDQDKYDALAAATCLVNPSVYESLSFSVLEAWSVACPALVNSRCDVLVEHVGQSGGGLTYGTDLEFIAAVKSLLSSPPLGRGMGLKGQNYVRSNYTWETVEGTLLDFLSELHNPPST